MRAIGVLRVSTDEQIDGVSLDSQRQKIEAYCAVYDIQLVGIECDAGYSGRNLNRPGVQRALGKLRRGEADALIVARLDRLTRRTRDLLDLVESYFVRGDRVLLSVHEKIDTGSAAGRMILTVLGALAEFERAQISERVSSAMQHMRSEGRYTGGRAPYGWALVEGALVPVESEQATIARARALRATNPNMSLRDVAATLEAEGHVSRVGRAFAAKQIAGLLSAD